MECLACGATIRGSKMSKLMVHLLEEHNLQYSDYHYAYIDGSDIKKCNGCKKHGRIVRTISKRNGR